MAELSTDLPLTVSTRYVLEIAYNGKMVLGIKTDGSVVLGEGFTADDAAREFWKFVESIRIDGKPVMDWQQTKQ